MTDGPPPGVAINTSSGLFSGTPTTAGSYTFLVTATDNAGGVTTQTYTLTIAAAGTITGVTNASAPFSTTAQNVTLNATVTDGIPVNEGTVTFTVTQGATTIGTPVTSGTVASGAATATYALPASQAPGTYTLTAVYNPPATNPNFLDEHEHGRDADDLARHDDDGGDERHGALRHNGAECHPERHRLVGRARQ